jgi:hypothetical protein
MHFRLQLMSGIFMKSNEWFRKDGKKFPDVQMQLVIHYTDFHESRNYSTPLSVHRLLQISLKCALTCVKYG